MSDESGPRCRDRFQWLVCDGPSCGLTHESDLLKAEIEARIAADPDLKSRVSVVDFTCFGRCDEGPNMMIHRLRDGEDPEEEPEMDAIDGERGFYVGVDEPKIERLIQIHLRRGEPLPEAEEY